MQTKAIDRAGKDQFSRKTLRTISPLVYLAVRTDIRDSLKLVRLLYMADKYRLFAYGKTVTQDEHVCTPAGASGVLAISIMNVWPMGYEAYHDQLAGNPSIADVLDEQDVEALDFAIDTFRSFTTDEFSRYIWSLPECQRRKGLRLADNTAEPAAAYMIDVEDMMKHPRNDPYFAIPLSYADEASRWMTGERCACGQSTAACGTGRCLCR